MRWAGSHPTNTRANGHNTTNNNQQPSKHPAHKTRPGHIVEVLDDSGGRSPLIIKDLDLYPQPPTNTRSPTLNSEEPFYSFIERAV